MTLVEEAVDAGARRERAVQTLGLTVRTLQRWSGQGADSDDQRCGPRTSPANKLSSAERRRLLAVANTPEYRDLSPQQIVPRLADEQGLYLASESTACCVKKSRWRIGSPRGRPRRRGLESRWPLAPTKCGRGIFPGCRGLSAAPSSTCI